MILKLVNVNSLNLKVETGKVKIGWFGTLLKDVLSPG